MRTQRPWGFYKILEKSETYQVKMLHVNPKSRMSYQFHNYRSENWVVSKGEILVIKNDKEYLLKKGEHMFIPIGCKHRICNTTSEPAEIIEVQIGEIISEEDIVRIDDDYGRNENDSKNDSK